MYGLKPVPFIKRRLAARLKPCFFKTYSDLNSAQFREKNLSIEQELFCRALMMLPWLK